MESNAMDHSYEELRQAAIAVLTGKVTTQYGAAQYANFKIGVAMALGAERASSSEPSLSRADADAFLEVFWDLFRQGIITLGLDDSNREFPFFRLSAFGERVLKNESAYFFHDLSALETRVNKEIPNIDETTLLYLKESLQAFRSGCILSATVMLGVATEHTFLLLLEAIEGNPRHQPTFGSVTTARTILQRFNRFRNILNQEAKSLPAAVKEDLDTNFAGILSVIPTFRNESGHPTGKIIDREQAYVLLQLFIPFCKKMYQLRDYFSTS